MNLIRQEKHEVIKIYQFSVKEVKTILLNHIDCNGVEKNITEHHSTDKTNFRRDDGLGYELIMTYQNNPSKWEII